MKKHRLNVGSELVRRLKDLNEVLQTTDNVTKRFICHDGKIRQVYCERIKNCKKPLL